MVTGASRGIGRSIALELAAAGARVIVTGRTKSALDETVRTADEAAPPGCGRSVAVVCDHGDDAAVARLFEEVERIVGEAGLDLLVNCAYAGIVTLTETMGEKFWEKGVNGSGKALGEPGEMFDRIFRVGLRSNYVALVRAVRMMVPRKRGLVVNVSSFGGALSIFDGLYSTDKCANDRMTAEMAPGLVSPKDTGVRMVTLYPGAVNTETLQERDEQTREAATNGVGGGDFYGLFPAETLDKIAWNFESPRYVGKVVSAILAQADKRTLTRWNGKIVIAAEAGNTFGVRDLDGEKRYSIRSLRNLAYSAVPALRESWLGMLVPDFVVPWFLVASGLPKAA